MTGGAVEQTATDSEKQTERMRQRDNLPVMRVISFFLKSLGGKTENKERKEVERMLELDAIKQELPALQAKLKEAGESL